MMFAMLARVILVSSLALLSAMPAVAQQGTGTTLRFIPHADLSILDPYFTGVYITRTRNGRVWNSITNVGHRPTFGGGQEMSIETFLLDLLEGPAPAHISVEFLRRVRDERKFETPEALKAQILKDVGRAQAFFRRSKRWITHS